MRIDLCLSLEKILYMKKTLILNFSLLLFCMSCNTDGHRGTSESIADSKERKTYLYTCRVFTSSEKADGYLLPNIREVFIEKSWFVGKPESSYDSDFLNIAIITNNDAFFEKHAIGDFTFTGKNILTLGMDRSMLIDTLRFGLYERENSYTRDNGEKICDVYIVKKN